MVSTRRNIFESGTTNVVNDQDETMTQSRTGQHDIADDGQSNSRDNLRVITSKSAVDGFPGRLTDGSMPVPLEDWLVQLEALCRTKGSITDADFMNEARAHIKSNGYGDAPSIVNSPEARKLTTKVEFVKFLRKCYKTTDYVNPFKIAKRIFSNHIDVAKPHVWAKRADELCSEFMDLLRGAGWISEDGENHAFSFDVHLVRRFFVAKVFSFLD